MQEDLTSRQNSIDGLDTMEDSSSQSQRVACDDLEQGSSSDARQTSEASEFEYPRSAASPPDMDTFVSTPPSNAVLFKDANGLQRNGAESTRVEGKKSPELFRDLYDVEESFHITENEGYGESAEETVESHSHTRPNQRFNSSEVNHPEDVDPQNESTSQILEHDMVEDLERSSAQNQEQQAQEVNEPVRDYAREQGLEPFVREPSNAGHGNDDHAQILFDDLPAEYPSQEGRPIQTADFGSFRRSLPISFYENFHPSVALSPLPSLQQFLGYESSQPEQPSHLESEEGFVSSGGNEHRTSLEQDFELEVTSDTEYGTGNYHPTPINWFDSSNSQGPVQRLLAQQPLHRQPWSHQPSVQHSFTQQSVGQQLSTQQPRTLMPQPPANTRSIQSIWRRGRNAGGFQPQILGPVSSVPAATPVAATRSPPVPPGQSQRWRSLPDGPYLRGTKTPKKVVRNCFLTPWFTRNRRDVRLPSATGQNFKAQNAAFDSLPPHQQAACNAWIVTQVEAEQARRRANGTARYYVDNSNPPVIPGPHARRSAVNAIRPSFDGSGAARLQNNPQARMHGLADAALLGQHIAPAPPGYNQRSHSDNGSNTDPVHRQSMSRGESQVHHAFNSSLGQMNPHETFEGFHGHANGRPVMTQPPVSHPALYNGFLLPQHLNIPISQYRNSITYRQTSTTPNRIQPGQPNVGINGMLPGSLSPASYPSYITQQSQQMLGYGCSVTGKWHENGSLYNAHLSNTYGFQSDYQHNGDFSMRNFGMRSGVDNNQNWGPGAHVNGPSMHAQGFQNQLLPNNMMTNVTSHGRKRKLADEEPPEEENGHADDRPPKKARAS